MGAEARNQEAVVTRKTGRKKKENNKEKYSVAGERGHRGAGKQERR
jgi:hypothetical protein